MRNVNLTQSQHVVDNQAEISSAQYISIDPDCNVVYIASEGSLCAFNSVSKEVCTFIKISPFSLGLIHMLVKINLII